MWRICATDSLPAAQLPTGSFGAATTQKWTLGEPVALPNFKQSFMLYGQAPRSEDLLAVRPGVDSLKRAYGL